MEPNEKFQNFQKSCNPVLVTCLVGQASHMPQSRAYIEGCHDSLAGQSPNHEKDLEFFFKNLGIRFLSTQFGDLFVSGSSGHEYTQKVSRLPSRLPCGWTSQSRKTLRQFFQNFVTKVLETWSGDLFTTHISCKNRVFCALRTEFKKKKLFNFPSNILTVHCLVCSSLSQTHRVSFKNPPFSSSFPLQTSRKGIGFPFF